MVLSLNPAFRNLVTDDQRSVVNIPFLREKEKKIGKRERIVKVENFATYKKSPHLTPEDFLSLRMHRECKIVEL